MKITRKLILLVSLICISSTSVFGGSQIVAWAKRQYAILGLPNITEYSWIASMTNIFKQTADLARTTASVMRQFQNSYEQLLETKKQIQNAYQDIVKLYRNFDPYDMDVWASTITGAQRVINVDCQRALIAFGNVNFLPAFTAYVFKVDSIMNYDYRRRQNSDFVDDVFGISYVDSVWGAYAQLFSDFGTSTILTIESRVRELEVRRSSPDLSDDARERMDESIVQLNAIKLNVARGPRKQHIDTLMAFMSELVSYNLTEIQMMQFDLDVFREMAGGLVSMYYELKSGGGLHQGDRNDITNVWRDTTQSRLPDSIDVYIYVQENSDKEPDVAPRPQEVRRAPGRNSPARIQRRTEVSSQDIAHLQNIVDYVQLQQEMLLRDIALLQARSTTALTTAEAYERELVHIQRLGLVNSAYELVGGKQ